MNDRHAKIAAVLIVAVTPCLVVLLALALRLHVSVEQRGHVVVKTEPTEGAVHPYPGRTTTRSTDGPFLAVFLTTKDDLEKLSEKWTYFLYFELLPCSQTSHGTNLFEGTVFAATQEERERVLAPAELSEYKLYKVHIPLDVQAIIRQASTQGGLDLPSYLETAQRRGLCVRVGGGQMWNLGLFSNLVSVPLAIRDYSLVVVSN